MVVCRASPVTKELRSPKAAGAADAGDGRAGTEAAGAEAVGAGAGVVVETGVLTQVSKRVWVGKV